MVLAVTMVNKALNEVEWTEFFFSEVFDIKKGFYNKKPRCSGNGKIPFLGATSKNNGITEFYTLQELENGSRTGNGKNESIDKKLFDGNCIVVTNNGSVGHAYYQPTDFTCSHDINPLYLKNHELNRNLAIFLICSIEKQRICFEYARKWRPIRMIKSKIMLPVTKTGQPNYTFMEEYIRDKESLYLDIIKKGLSNKLGEPIKVVSVSEKKWLGFDISEIFNIRSGERLVKTSMKKGFKPFIGASNFNNGVTEFVSNYNNSIDSNVLGVNYNGSVVDNFYHPYKCLFSDDVKRFSLKEIDGNKYIYLFIKSAILMQKSKYEYGYKFNANRMEKQKILLPVDLDGRPDYEYMKQYMCNIEKKQISEYLKYIEN